MYENVRFKIRKLTFLKGINFKNKILNNNKLYILGKKKYIHIAIRYILNYHSTHVLCIFLAISFFLHHVKV